jgi:putative transposase
MLFLEAPPMPGPLPAPVELTAEEERGLAAFIRRHTAPQHLVARARIILLAADGLNNCQIARQLDLDVETVRLWRQRWLGCAGVTLADLSIEERLIDAPRAGRAARITAEQYCRLVALACEAPGATGRPISQWSGRELADEVVARGIVATISPRHAARLLKRGTSNRTVCATG